MKKLMISMIISSVLIFWITQASAITWGEPDNEHMNVGAMVVGYPGFGLFQMCSGTLIHPQIFLTAGHCTAAVEGLGIPVWVNFDQDALNEITLMKVVQVINHPDYNMRTMSNPYDVGVLILESQVTDITPATLPSEYFLSDLRENRKLRRGSNGAEFTVVGYGGTLDWPPPEITYDNYRQYAISEFLNLRKVWLLLSQNQAKGDGGTCFGDSGGPAFFIEDGEEIIVGITSWGDANCVATGNTYRVDIPETLEFINSIINSIPQLD